MLTEKEINKNKERVISLLKSTKREGIKNLINFLYTSGYFNAWGSPRHHKYKGGLTEHSLEVYEEAMGNNNGCPEDSIIICSLMHDLCKGVYFCRDCDKYIGHGAKSAAVLTDYLKFNLTPEEWRAIRFHMLSRSTPRTPEEQEQFDIAKNEDLCRLIHESDCISIGKYQGATKLLVKSIMRGLKL